MQIANLVASTNNVGVSAVINVWTPDVITEEFSEVSAFVATDDGAASNVIQVGWLVRNISCLKNVNANVHSN